VKIFIAGATGVLGRGLIREFLGRGHVIVGLARSSAGEQLIRSLGGEPRRGDIFDADSLARAAEGTEVIIHAATSIPAKTRTKPVDWEMNDRLRREGTSALSLCAMKVGARLYLQQSIVWLARPHDGSPFDETSEPQTDDVTRSALDAETIAFEAGVHHGFNVSVLRCGMFYGPDAASTRTMGELLLKRKLPIIGSGDALLSCLHTDDAASAFATAAEGARTGLWHVVDDRNVAVKEMMSYFAERLNAPTPRRVPAWLARLLAGKNAVSFFTSSTRTSNALFRKDFGWSPRYPSYREGLEQVIQSWKAEGFIKP
jgi:nucleoside-diphosphate-sugar epimerase